MDRAREILDGRVSYAADPYAPLTCGCPFDPHRVEGICEPGSGPDQATSEISDWCWMDEMCSHKQKWQEAALLITALVSDAGGIPACLEKGRAQDKDQILKRLK